MILGFLIDFILFKFAGIPFLLYAIYGFDQVKKAIKENADTTKISQGELKFPTNKRLITLKKGDLKDIEITIEKTDNEFYLGHFRIIDSKNIGYVVFIFVDDEPQILRGNMEDLKAFILIKLNQ